MSEAARIIKKYPNRRLYDTATSSYITITDIKALVLGQIEFRVVDARSNADLTRCTLLQIILEEENCGAPLFSCDTLAQVIRFYGHAMQGQMCNYLEQHIKTFAEAQCPDCGAPANSAGCSELFGAPDAAADPAATPLPPHFPNKA